MEHLVYASSSSVYGKSKNIPHSIHEKIDNPISLYAAIKNPMS
ncbi:NAD-dependent epimerase/dehydratase family protein [Bacteroides acidifaciens]|nr:NAD-dependent epimerase/dehydratase family protein [Bacteroides acidifaciens]